MHPADLPVFVDRAQAILKRFDVTASFLIHSATGQVHLRPILDPDQPADAAKLWPLAEDLHGLVLDLGGTVSAQNGTGLARTPWVERQHGPLFLVFRELKGVFDPHGILNPGKIVGPDPSRPAWPLRGRTMPPTDAAAETSVAAPAVRAPLLVWAPDEAARAVAACNGCGACRTEAPTHRMCPTFHATHAEAATPRAKANLFRALLESGAENARPDEVRAVADLCVNCKMCASECPGKADIPKLMLEAKAANHAADGLRRSAWFLARIDGLASLANTFALTTNFLLRRASVRWVLEKVFGLARRRTLPAFAFRSFLSRARRRGWTRRPRATAPRSPTSSTRSPTCSTRDRGGDDRRLAPQRRPRLRAAASTRLRGRRPVARRHRRRPRALAVQRPSARRPGPGRRHHRLLGADGRTLLPAGRPRPVGRPGRESSSPSGRSSSLRTCGRFTSRVGCGPTFEAVDYAVGHHVPCHVKALGQGVRGPGLLALIPGLRVSTIDVSCSGMAGTYGLNAKNLPLSLAAGRPMLDELAPPGSSVRLDRVLRVPTSDARRRPASGRCTRCSTWRWPTA